jgi:hypothetical protein
MVVLTCYNKACSTKGKFEDNKNGPEACRFHPGGPVFHDALKVSIKKNYFLSYNSRVYLNGQVLRVDFG